MSELQIGLLVIGAVVVVAVFAFNQYQERRFRKQADSVFPPPVADPLQGARGPVDAVSRESRNRVEPALREPVFEPDDGGVVVDIAEPRLHLDHEPAPAAMPAVEVQAEIPREQAPPVVFVAPRSAGIPAMAAPAPYDEIIEYRVRLQGEIIQANMLAGAFNQVRGLGKAVRWYGLPVGATVWEEVQPWRDAHYQQVTVTLQLADRNGAAAEEQMTGLCDALTAVSRAHGLRVACDEIADAVERAQSIDRFCVDVDVLIGLNVVARGEGSINLARIVREAVSGGMVLGADGVFQLLDSRGEPLYALCNHDAEPFVGEVREDQVSQGVTLQFDVPRVPDGIKVFDSMVTFGRRLANEVGGILVDDNLRPLTDAGIDKIRSQLVQIYERMEARGVPSGSRRALRLFS